MVPAAVAPAAAGGLGGLMVPLLALSAGTGLLSVATNAADRKKQEAAAERQRKLDILQSIISIAGGKGPMGIDATPNITPSNAGQAIGGVGNDMLNILATDSAMKSEAARAAAAAAQTQQNPASSTNWWDAFASKG